MNNIIFCGRIFISSNAGETRSKVIEEKIFERVEYLSVKLASDVLFPVGFSMEAYGADFIGPFDLAKCWFIDIVSGVTLPDSKLATGINFLTHVSRSESVHKF